MSPSRRGLLVDLAQFRAQRSPGRGGDLPSQFGPISRGANAVRRVGACPRLVLSCLSQNERGDGILYATLHRGRFLYSQAAGMWMVRIGGRWTPDLGNEAFLAVEEVALLYRREGGKLAVKVRQLEKRNAAPNSRATEDAGPPPQAQARDLGQKIAELSAIRDALARRVDRLHTISGVRRVLWWARHIERPLLEEALERAEHARKTSP